MNVLLAADHAGVALKGDLVAALKTWGHAPVDLGPTELVSVDYPDFAQRLCGALLKGDAPLGVLICGTGIGMSIAANKVHGIRAALCRTEFEARMARAHNDATVLCLGQRVTGNGLAAEVLKAFIETRFEGGRHQTRVAKMEPAR